VALKDSTTDPPLYYAKSSVEQANLLSAQELVRPLAEGASISNYREVLAPCRVVLAIGRELEGGSIGLKINI